MVLFLKWEIRLLPSDGVIIRNSLVRLIIAQVFHCFLCNIFHTVNVWRVTNFLPSYPCGCAFYLWHFRGKPQAMFHQVNTEWRQYIFIAILIVHGRP